jgi:hypothetical protein
VKASAASITAASTARRALPSTGAGASLSDEARLEQLRWYVTAEEAMQAHVAGLPTVADNLIGEARIRSILVFSFQN